MHHIPADAIARLVMVSGSLTDVAEIAQILESYSYQQDNDNPDRWILSDVAPSDASAALEFSQNGEIIDVYSDSDENILNLNYIAMRIGWAECNLYASSKEIADTFLLRLVNVSVANPNPTSYDVEASSPSHILEPTISSNATMAKQAGQPSIDAFQEDYWQIQELRSKLAKAEQKNEELAVEMQQLRQRIQELESLPVNSERLPNIGELSSNSSTDPILIKIVEKHLLSQLDLSAMNQSGLLKELNEHGYAVHVKLTRQ